MSVKYYKVNTQAGGSFLAVKDGDTYRAATGNETTLIATKQVPSGTIGGNSIDDLNHVRTTPPPPTKTSTSKPVESIAKTNSYTTPQAPTTPKEYVRIKTSSGYAFFEQTSNGLAAVNDQTIRQGLINKTIPSTEQGQQQEGANAFSSQLSNPTSTPTPTPVSGESLAKTNSYTTPQTNNATVDYLNEQSSSTLNPADQTSQLDFLKLSIETYNLSANDSQKSLLEALQSNNISNEVETRGSTELVNAFITDQGAEEAGPPAPPSFTAQYDEYRQSLGVNASENQLLDVNSQIAELEAGVSNFNAEQDDRRTSTVQINRRKDAGQKVAEAELRDLYAKKGSIVEELNMKNNTISTIMQLSQTDYANATAFYDTNFNRAISLIGILQQDEEIQMSDQRYADAQSDKEFQKALDLYAIDRGEQQDKLNLSLELFQIQEGLRIEKRDTASANLSTMQNLILEESINFADLTQEQKLQIQQLELQSGLPVGTTEAIQNTILEGGGIDNSKVLSYKWSADETQVSVLFDDGNGVIKTKVIDSQLPSKITTKKEKEVELLKSTDLSNLARAGVPNEVANYLQQNLNDGYSEAEIKSDLRAQFAAQELPENSSVIPEFKADVEKRAMEKANSYYDLFIKTMSKEDDNPSYVMPTKD